MPKKPLSPEEARYQEARKDYALTKKVRREVFGLAGPSMEQMQADDPGYGSAAAEERAYRKTRALREAADAKTGRGFRAADNDARTVGRPDSGGKVVRERPWHPDPPAEMTDPSTGKKFRPSTDPTSDNWVSPREYDPRWADE